MKTPLRALSSSRLTLVGMVLLVCGLIVDQRAWLPGSIGILLPIALLAVNLAVALAVDRRFRYRPALFAFHLCLLLLALVAGYGQLARYEGRVALVEGQDLDAALVVPVRRGWIDPPPLPDGLVRQGRIAVDYRPGLRRAATHSRVSVHGADWIEIGDDIPLVVDGYRLYTTPNKGLAALLTWHPHDRAATAQLGAVQFPSFPASQLMQQTRWQAPGGEAVDLVLTLPGSPVPHAGEWVLDASLAKQAQIEVQASDGTEALRPGASVALHDGRLQFERVVMWMGYEVHHDPTPQWMFSLAFLGVICLALHFVGAPRLAARRLAGLGQRGAA